MRLTAKQLAALGPAARAQIEAKMAAAKTGAKYRNRHTTGADGVTYDSAAEARRAAELEMLRRAGRVAKVERQVEYRLPCGVAYRADFVVTLADDARRIEDVKGFQTAVFKMKRKMLKRCPCLPGGPITIEVIP